jgi:anthranilate synthase component 1
MTYQFHTISKQVLGDLQTPVSIYLKVRDIYPESALLESSDFHGNTNSLSLPYARWEVSGLTGEQPP